MKLQEEVLGYSLVVRMHANCHRAIWAFHDAMDHTHELLDAVSVTLLTVVASFRKSPTSVLFCCPMFAQEINASTKPPPPRPVHK